MSDTAPPDNPAPDDPAPDDPAPVPAASAAPRRWRLALGRFAERGLCGCCTGADGRMDRALDPGRWLALDIEPDPGSEEAMLDAAAALAAGPVPVALTALARASGGALVLSLVAALPAGGAGPVSLALWTDAPPRPEPDGAPSVAFMPEAGTTRATAGLLARADDEVLALAELGGRMDDPARLGRLAHLAGRLEAAGLAPLATLLAGLAEAPEAQRADRLLGFVHASRCHATLSARLPFVVVA